MLELPLAELQHWMQDVVVHHGSPDEAVRSESARARVEVDRLAEVILPSSTLTPTERLAVYQGMYLLRMYDALASDYEALEHFLGHRRFRELVAAYVEVHPSRSFTLNRLGDHLPEFIRTTQHAIQRREFCHELARLELSITEVFDGSQAEPLSEEAIAAVPPEAWERARFEPVASLRLLEFRYPVNDYLQTVKDDDHDHPPARLTPNRVAVFRRHYSVYRLGLSRAAFGLLSELAAGQPLGASIEKTLRRRGRERPQAEQLFRWFRQWMSGGVFRSVRYD